MQGNNSFRYVIRIIAGVYLLYLAWNLMGGLRSGETSGFVFIIGIAVFIIAGVFFILDALRNMRREALDSRAESLEDQTPSEENEEEPLSEETTPDDDVVTKKEDEP